jgi:hypothetical protein
VKWGKVSLTLTAVLFKEAFDMIPNLFLHKKEKSKNILKQTNHT